MAIEKETGREAGSAAAPAGTVQPAGDAQEDLKRQLLWRMGLAGLMILALLGVLVLFDYANAPDDSPAGGQLFTEPVTMRKREPVQPLTPVDTVVEESPAVVDQAATEVASQIAGEGGATRSTSAAAASLPAAEKAGSTAGGRPGVLVEPPPPPRVAATPALPPAARKGTAGAANTTSAEPPPPVVSNDPLLEQRLATGYIVQSGLFSDLALAEEWQARLAREGIPSTLEARLQIGPFKNRAEADAARRKLDRLGIDAPVTIRRIGNR